MSAPLELLVVGAGPAGISAATAAAEAGASVCLIDEQAGPGGQIYRNAESPGLRDTSLLGPDYARGTALAAALRYSRVDYRPQTGLWQLSPELEAGLIDATGASLTRARHVVLANGASERPMPIPGWTLPGVMTAGAGQILLKSAGLVPDTPVVLAGCGPLLLLVAWQYLRAGVPIAAVLETTPAGNYRAALRHLPAALTTPGPLLKGLRLIAALRRGGVRHERGVTALKAVGDQRLEAVEYTTGGRTRRLDCQLLLLHQGVVPATHVASAAGCALDWDPRGLYWRPRVDAWGNSTVSGITIAGDGAGILGALAAEASGRLAGLEAARALGHIDASERDRRAGNAPGVLVRQRRLRAFLDTLYQPTAAFRIAADDTLVCRCEEVRGGALREAVALGCGGPNQAKSYTRCGMGPCQGRQCGLPAAELIAAERGVSMSEIAPLRIRPPLKPMTLAQLACAAPEEEHP